MARSFLATGLWVRYRYRYGYRFRFRGESWGAVNYGSHSSSSIVLHAGEQKVEGWDILIPVIDDEHRPLSLRHHREGLS
jgi:hypothetical protein